MQPQPRIWKVQPELRKCKASHNQEYESAATTTSTVSAATTMTKSAATNKNTKSAATNKNNGAAATNKNIRKVQPQPWAQRCNCNQEYEKWWHQMNPMDSTHVLFYVIFLLFFCTLSWSGPGLSALLSQFIISAEWHKHSRKIKFISPSFWANHHYPSLIWLFANFLIV